MNEPLARITVTTGWRVRRASIAAVLAVTIACASSSTQQRVQEAYERRWAVTVTSKPEDIKSCTRVASFTIASLPCTNLVHNAYMAGTECACFWTVERGGDTLLLKGGRAGDTFEFATAGDVYVCSAPLLPEAQE